MSTPPPTVSETPLFHSLYKLYRHWHGYCHQLPKKDRHTIGQKIENNLLDLLVAVTTAYHAKDISRKLHILTDANISLESVKILIRLAKDVHAINILRYVDYETGLRDIGKMLGGWIAHLNKTNR